MSNHRERRRPAHPHAAGKSRRVWTDYLRMDSRVSISLTVLMLIGSAILGAARQNDAAAFMAEAAFILLLASVTGALIELYKEDR